MRQIQGEHTAANGRVARYAIIATMPETVNLTSEIKRQLPSEMVDFMRWAGEEAAQQGRSLYLVGGVVRDLFLQRPNFDMDLVVDSDAISLARRLAKEVDAKLTIHARFNTARIRWDRWSVDLATVRSETYERPGALPKVGPGTLDTDLLRRDFTINAMAIELTASRYGRLIDVYGGQADLEGKFIRVLHENSFTDDATRIWRAIRYEQRLVFRLEPVTRKLLRRDIPMLDTISGDRIRHELELVLKEERPEKSLRRAGELGVLARLHPSLRGDGWLARKFRQARRLSLDGQPSPELYFALLGYSLNPKEADELIAYLRLSRTLARDLRDTAALKGWLDALEGQGLKPSGIYDLLNGFSPTAIAAARIAAGSATARRHMALYLNKLRQVKLAVTGDDLVKMGFPAGPKLKEILQRLLEARLDGEVKNKECELEMAANEFGGSLAGRPVGANRGQEEKCQ